MEKETNKTAEEMILETEQKLTKVLNESQLTPGVLELILRNIYAQVRDTAMAISKHQPVPNTTAEEE